MTLTTAIHLKLYCSIFILLLLTNSVFCCDSYSYQIRPNVRTVLYDKYDVEKSCWPIEDVGLLLNRYIAQGLLPCKAPKDVAVLFDYILSTLELLKTEVQSKKARKVILTALVDTFGGYLKSYGIPITNELFYEGRIQPRMATIMHILLEDMTYTLKTDGSGWPPPIIIKKQIYPILPLNFTQEEFQTRCHTKEKYCNALILESADCNLTTNAEPSNYANKENCKAYNINPSRIKIPLPFYDDCNVPHAIALPLKKTSLYSLTSNSSVGIFTKYYKTSMYCMHELCEGTTEKSACRAKIKQFNVRLYDWMVNSVLPHLRSRTSWYPAFYEVLRVFKTTIVSKNIIVKNETRPSEFTCKGFWAIINNSPLGTIGWIAALFLVLLVLLICCICYSLLKRRRCEDECCNDEDDIRSSILPPIQRRKIIAPAEKECREPKKKDCNETSGPSSDDPNCGNPISRPDSGDCCEQTHPEGNSSNSYVYCKPRDDRNKTISYCMSSDEPDYGSASCYRVPLQIHETLRIEQMRQILNDEKTYDSSYCNSSPTSTSSRVTESLLKLREKYAAKFTPSEKQRLEEEIDRRLQRRNEQKVKEPTRNRYYNN